MILLQGPRGALCLMSEISMQTLKGLLAFIFTGGPRIVEASDTRRWWWWGGGALLDALSPKPQALHPNLNNKSSRCPGKCRPSGRESEHCVVGFTFDDCRGQFIATYKDSRSSRSLKKTQTKRQKLSRGGRQKHKYPGAFWTAPFQY